MTLSIRDLFSVAQLGKVWRAVRGSFHEQLVRDPLDHLAFEANLASNLRQLAFVVCENRYSPAPPNIVRAAKGNGLTRALSFLEITDTLVLKTIVDAIQSNLHKELPDCVLSSRSQRKAFCTKSQDYETWFQAWMRHQRVVERLLKVQGCEWVVRADVSNFFPSINHQLLYQTVIRKAGADEHVINLLFLILESMAPRPGYSGNRGVGLPQEDYDASRILAHTYLGSIDKDFEPEISQGRYARWVDDTIVGVRTQAEGRQVLRRLEQALENWGLFVNSAKSSIIPIGRFADSLYPEWNQFLDGAERSAKSRSKAAKVEPTEFDAKLDEFLQIREGERLENWDRILRRFYTVSRHMGSSVLENHALDHLRRFPASATKILGYLLGRPFNMGVRTQIFEYLKSPDNIYENAEILIYEFLLKWAVPDNAAVCQDLAETCLDHFFARNLFREHPPLTEHTRGLMALVIYKFGTPTHLAEFAGSFLADSVCDPTFARYALCALSGTSGHCDEALAAAAKLEDRATRRLHSFLASARTDPRPYERTLKKYVSAVRVTHPTYVFFPARMLPLVKLVRDSNSRVFRHDWDRHLHNVTSKLEKSPQPLRDERSIRVISREYESP